MNTSQNSEAKPQNNRRTRQLLLLDFCMIGLLCLNLALIVFDAFFEIKLVRSGLDSLLPSFTAWYADAIHANFLLIDLVFISIFFSEFLFSWFSSLRQRETNHWYEYPLLHWYDLLGCIPLDAMRLFRMLRVFSILFRLHRMGLIDVTTWAPWRWAMGIYAMVVEEISDRVVLNVLTGVQTELTSGVPIEDRIVKTVIEPRQAQLSESIANGVAGALESGYGEHREAISAWLAERVRHIVERNGGAKTFSKIPWIGESTLNRLESTVAETITDVLDETIDALNSQQIQNLIDEVLASVIQRADGRPDQGEITNLIVEILEVVKEQVAIKHYQERAVAGMPDLNADPIHIREKSS